MIFRYRKNYKHEINRVSERMVHYLGKFILEGLHVLEILVGAHVPYSWKKKRTSTLCDYGELLCLLVLVAMCVGVGGDGGVGGIYTEDMLIAVAELQLIEKDLGAPLDRHARSWYTRSVHVFVYLCCPSLLLPICLSIYLSVHLSIDLWRDLSIY